MKRGRCGLAAAFVLVAVGSGGVWAWRAMQDKCGTTELTSAPSPDGAWRAAVAETDCDGFVPNLTDSVTLTAAGAADAVSVLGIDSGGGGGDHPVLLWTAADRLRVTVPNLSLLKVLTRRVGKVSVDVAFDPPDPAARAAWLKANGVSGD